MVARRTCELAGVPAALFLGALVLLASAEPARARDRGADGSFEKRTSSHFALYQDVDIDKTSGLRGSRNFENQVLDTLESAYDKLDQYLSLRPRRRIDVVIYDPQLFDAQFAGMFRFAAAGFYSGTIHIRGDVRVHQSLVGTLHHELVHAAFDAEAPSLGLPAWFNEGVSEWFEARSIGKRQLSVRQFRALSQNAAAGTMFGLAQLSSRSFGGFGQEAAQLAYLQSYAFIDYLSHEYGERSLRGLVATLLRKRDLSRAFETSYHRGLPELEAGFVAHYLESAGG
jgi:hypothetical protein